MILKGIYTDVIMACLVSKVIKSFLNIEVFNEIHLHKFCKLLYFYSPQEKYIIIII